MLVIGKRFFLTLAQQNLAIGYYANSERASPYAKVWNGKNRNSILQYN